MLILLVQNLSDQHLSILWSDVNPLLAAAAAFVVTQAVTTSEQVANVTLIT